MANRPEQITAPPQETTADLSRTTPAAPKGAADLLIRTAREDFR